MKSNYLISRYSYLKNCVPLVLILLIMPGGYTTAQIFEGNGYLISDRVEVAIDGDGGHEGTADWPGHHARGGSEEVPFGFVANTGALDWSSYNGDYFTSGVPENGFGLEINGINYSNNAWNSETLTPYLQEIPSVGTISHTFDGGCSIIDWTGHVAGVTISLRYRLHENDLFYTTEVTLQNTSATNLTDVYYYRNVDPDNNESIGGTFNTTNTIVSQPSLDCIKALVSATQPSPWSSYVGLGGLDENFRVSHGGFSNRDGSDIWNAVGLNGDVGDVVTDDESISLAYKTDLAAGEAVKFTYATVLSSSAVEYAFSSLYYIDYESDFDIGGGEISPCNPETIFVSSCAGNTITLEIEGPSTENYSWTWAPMGEVGDSVQVTLTEEATVTVVGSPTMACLTEAIVKSVVVVFDQGPQISLTDPDPICGEFNIDSLDYWNTGDEDNDNCVFLTEIPTSADQTEPAFEGPMVGPDDVVYVMCGDTETGCFDWFELELDFVGPGAAGPDTLLEVCGGIGLTINLNEIISDTANQNGYYYDPTDTLSLDTTGFFNASNTYGTYEFYYIIEPVEPCEGDTAVLTVTILESPIAYFEFEVDGVPSGDGIFSTCVSNDIDFINLSSIGDPGVITEWGWQLGDGTDSDEYNPSHTYDVGYYNAELQIESDNGCTSYFSRPIMIYFEPPMDVIVTQPLCHGDSDGVITVEHQLTGDYTLEVTNEIGTVINDDDTSVVTGLPGGTYMIYLEDESGCSASQEITLEDPDELVIYMRAFNPPCLGDSGYAVVDSVLGAGMNNPVTFEWDPNPAGISGSDADSSYWMVAGDYTVTATDVKGCSTFVDFTLVDPPPFYFTEWGWDTAYCRLYPYQNGNGVVYAAVAGGLPNYTYEWTYLVDGTTGTTSTWGGRNPGDHRIDVTDAGGCVLTKIITVDSVSPIAAFDIVSADLNQNLQGTAAVEVEFVNKSRYFSDPRDPNTDTTFFWDLDYTDEIDWIISHDYFERPDTIYLEGGESYAVKVCLIAFNNNGCSDTACKNIVIWEPPEISTVNVFTPDGDGKNDYFTFKNYQKGIREFNCIIVNRWGVQVGEINGVTNHWDGTNMLNGELCPDGVYFFTYTAVGDNGTEFSGHGNVTLVGQAGD